MSSEKQQQPPTIYVAIPAEPQVQVVSSVPIPVDGKVTQTRRRSCGCFCCTCCVWFILAALAFFILVPRTPIVYLDSLATDSNYGMVGKFNFQNDNFYPVSFSESKMKMYWLTDSATVFNVDDPNNACEFKVHVGHACGHSYDKDLCALRIATFDGEDDHKSFNVQPHHVDSHNLDLATTTENKAYIAEMLASVAGNGHALLFSTGHTHAKSSIRNYHDLKVEDSLYCYE